MARICVSKIRCFLDNKYIKRITGSMSASLRRSISFINYIILVHLSQNKNLLTLFKFWLSLTFYFTTVLHFASFRLQLQHAITVKHRNNLQLGTVDLNNAYEMMYCTTMNFSLASINYCLKPESSWKPRWVKKWTKFLGLCYATARARRIK